MRAVVYGLVVCGLAVGCNKSGKPDVKDPEKASQAEYDVAADALQKGNLRTALVHAKKAVDLDESNPHAQLLAANVYLGFCASSPGECRLEEAEKHARAALKIKSDLGDATNTLGVVLTHLKRYDEAIAVLKPLTENMLYNTPELAWGNLGHALLEKGEHGQAVVALKRALALQPAFCVGHYRLGLAYERQNDPKAALQAYSACLETGFEQCKFADAYEARARVLLKLNETRDARADLEQCAKVGAGSPTAKRCTAALGQSPPPP